MIEYILSTGNISTGELFYNRGQVFNGIGSIQNNNFLDNDITINGQTLLETVASISVVGQQEIITNSGQFFLSGSVLRNETGFLDLSFGVSNLKYDVGVTGVRKFHNSTVHADLLTGFSGKFDGGNVFLNGAKLTSGVHYVENANGDFSWTDPNNSVTGVLFSAPTRNLPIHTGRYDILNVRFNGGCNIGYLNGVKLDETAILETSSLLTGIIKTGIEPFVEFNFVPNSETLFL